MNFLEKKVYTVFTVFSKERDCILEVKDNPPIYMEKVPNLWKVLLYFVEKWLHGKTQRS